ncbi:MAG: SBBP repeat-containing protein [Planctomycetota bacterium]
MNRKSWNLFLLCLINFLICLNLSVAQERYDLAFSTYIGGSNWEHARDIFADKKGNLYVVGGTASPDFPTTPGAYDRTFNSGGKQTGSAGPCDALVMKFNPKGNIVWSTYLGGPHYDRAYAVEVDDAGYVHVAGRCGPGFPVTPGSFQTEYKGTYGNFYGAQNGFVAKLAPDGKRLVWSSYVGVGNLCRDLAIDRDGDVYVPLGYARESASVSPPKWFSTAFTNAFQKTPRSKTECGAVKIKSDGSQVLWATWIGGSNKDTQEASIRVDNRKRVYLSLNTNSVDIPTTHGAYDRTHNGDDDGYIALLKPDGSDLIYATYLGGSKSPFVIMRQI